MPPPTQANAEKYPERCDKCGGVTFADVDSGLGHAILEDGGREYWVILTVRCTNCGATYTGDCAPIGSGEADLVSWRPTVA